MKKILSPAYSLKLKNIILFLNRGLIFFSNGHIRNVVSTLPNVVKIDVENDNVVSTLSNVVQFNVEKHNVFQRCKFQRWRAQRCFNVDLRLCNVTTSYQPKNNFELTLKCLLGKLVIYQFLSTLEVRKMVAGCVILPRNSILHIRQWEYTWPP